MYKGQERREFKRIQKNFIVRFQVRAHENGKKLIPGWDMIAVVDLGAGGMLFYYDKKIEIGSILDLKISFSPDKPPIECSGKVIRAEDLMGGYMFLTAVIFQDIKDKEKDMINRVAEEYHVSSQDKK